MHMPERLSRMLGREVTEDYQVSGSSFGESMGYELTGEGEKLRSRTLRDPSMMAGSDYLWLLNEIGGRQPISQDRLLHKLEEMGWSEPHTLDTLENLEDRGLIRS